MSAASDWLSPDPALESAARLYATTLRGPLGAAGRRFVAVEDMTPEEAWVASGCPVSPARGLFQSSPNQEMFPWPT